MQAEEALPHLVLLFTVNVQIRQGRNPFGMLGEISKLTSLNSQKVDEFSRL